MMVLRKGASAALAALLSCTISQSSYACTGDADLVNDPVAIAPDGSFANANYHGQFPFPYYGPMDNSADTVYGAAIHDLGSGKIEQYLVFTSHPCNGEDSHLFVDCVSRQGILVAGWFGQDATHRRVFFWPAPVWTEAPDGTMVTAQETTVDGLEVLARNYGIPYTRDLEGFLGGAPDQDRYDPFYGCSSFYPNLVKDG